MADLGICIYGRERERERERKGTYVSTKLCGVLTGGPAPQSMCLEGKAVRRSLGRCLPVGH